MAPTPPLPDWIRDHQREIRVHLWRLTGSQEDAEELAQETFLRAYNAWQGFRGESSVRTWLYSIATNIGLNHLRSRRRETALEEGYDDFEESGTLEALEAEEERRIMGQALERLPPQQKAVVLLRIKEDLPFKDIAQVMGLTEGAVKAHFSFAVKRLKLLIAPILEAAV